MNFRSLGLISFFCLFGFSAAALTEPPLPSWNPEEHEKMLSDGWLAGSTLLTYEPLPEEKKADETPLEVEEPTPDELAEEVDENIVSEEYLSDYFAEKPANFIVDPQNLLSVKQQKDLSAFLNYHAGDSSIDMYVYVFGTDQEIPGDVREEEVVERLYSVGKPAVVLYYYLGAPQRSAMYLSPVITDAVSAAEQRRALQSSEIQAFDSVNSFDQLEAFLVQMSIRIYWMERMIEGTAVETMKTIPAGATARKFRVREQEDTSFVLPGWMKITLAAIISTIGGLLVISSLWMWLRSRQRFIFPDFEVEQRLGGSHAAGVGAVISFASSAVPPARQRDQVPDYMRRA
ncbi:hypothetical protein ACFSSA_07375 [Luteolibacter algae]|uniref:Uncharacterized protein n=1 Tax=Luteolibacter algae TaxID=454151 RepID=A0ABW5D6V5_9BACT